jgi:uncharacterized protein YbjT (DUF2867 family)
VNTKPILVLGGTGKTGRRIVERLTARNVPVRIGSRNARPPFEWENPATWYAALNGVDAVYISFYPDLAVPGAVEVIRELTRTAVASGVRRLVLLSGRGEHEAESCEDIVRAAGVEWTILRASWFSQNFSESYLLDPILAGDVVLPAGNVGEPFVDADDIADVAVAALTEGQHAGQLYELTGPRLWTFAEAVAEIGRVTGRPIRYTSIPVDDYEAELMRTQVPAEFVGLLRYLFSEVLDGRNARIADGVTRALGRPARDFSDYVRDTAASGVWKA